MNKKFNVRVYGLLFNDQEELLVTDEFEFGYPFTKLPGGGLEYGEGTLDCLKREFMEECALEIRVGEHVYTTDFFVESAFGTGQLISIYYRVHCADWQQLPVKQIRFDFEERKEKAQIFRWVAVNAALPEEMTFPIDKYVIERLLASK